MGKTDDDFLESLPHFLEFEGVTDPEHYQPLPEGWGLALADIVDSTGAISAGQYKAVNMAGAGVISAILNAVGTHDLPFAFGGDGAAVAIPPWAFGTARTALASVISWVEEDMQLAMRAAIVPVADIRAAGFDVRVARFNASQDVSYAMFAGGGNSWAETQMKNGGYVIKAAPPGTRPNLEGLSCRWNPIEARNGRIVSIIATPGPAGDAEAFSALIADIVTLAEDGRGGHPVPVDGPELHLSGKGLEAEAKARTRYGGRFVLWKHRLKIVGQYLLMRFLYTFKLTLGRFDPVVYKQDVARNTDFRKFDDGLKMTVDVDPGRQRQIETKLEAAAVAGVCYYGLHEQDEALMTCIVPSPLSRNHMHFVDGAAGGYATAASHLKAQAAVSNAAI